MSVANVIRTAITIIRHVSEILNCNAMILDEGSGNENRSRVKADTLHGARRISCFGESLADLLAQFFIGGKVDMFTPGDVVGIEKERLEFDLMCIFKPTPIV